MLILRRLARPLLASTFVVQGATAAASPGERVERAKPLCDLLERQTGQHVDPALFVRVNGGVQALAGLMLSLNRAPRISATVLAVSMAATTWAEHPFWSERTPERKATQRTQFLKNASIVGGLLLAAADTAGRPGLAWRTKAAVSGVGAASRRSSKRVSKQLKRAGGSVGLA